MSRVADAFGRTSTATVRDDRVLSATRWTARIVVAVLLVASTILFVFPDRTGEFFAWPISPTMTPLVMGAGYGTGLYFFVRVATTREWHRVAPVFPGIVAFVWIMAAATALHWENFTHGHPAFFAWVFLYVAAPLLIPVIWLRNQRTALPDEGEGGRRLPGWVRRVALASGAAVVLATPVLFVAPDALIQYWPWALSPLTARVLLGWFALFGVVNVFVGLDPRWSAAQIPIQTQLIGFGLMLLGAVRAMDDFDAASPFTWAFLGGFACYVGGLVVLYVAMERR